MPVLVVDGFQPDDVDEHGEHLLLVAAGHPHQLGDALFDAQAVQRPGQAIPGGEDLDLVGQLGQLVDAAQPEPQQGHPERHRGHRGDHPVGRLRRRPLPGDEHAAEEHGHRGRRGGCPGEDQGSEGHHDEQHGEQGCAVRAVPHLDLPGRDHEIRLPRGVEAGGVVRARIRAESILRIGPGGCRCRALHEWKIGRRLGIPARLRLTDAGRRRRHVRAVFQRIRNDAGERGIVEAVPPAGKVPRRRGDRKAPGIFPIGGQRELRVGETGNRTATAQAEEGQRGNEKGIREFMANSLAGLLSVFPRWRKMEDFCDPFRARYAGMPAASLPGS